MAKLRSFFIDVFRESDQTVFNLLNDVAAKLPGWSIRAVSWHSIASESATTHPFREAQEQIESILRLNTVALNLCQFEFSNGAAIQVHRHLDSANPSTLHDRIQLSPGGSSETDFLTLIAATRESFRPIDSLPLLEQLEDHHKEYLTARELDIHNLQNTLHGLFTKLQDFTISQTSQYQNRREHLEESFATRTQELENEHRAKLEAIEEERKKLDEQRKAMDLRESTAVRRSIREDVKTMLLKRSESFKLSDSAARRRRPIAIAYALLVAVLGTYSVTLFISQTNMTGRLDPYQLGRQVITTIGFVLSISFFIRWLNQWSQQHADEEFYMKRFELDFERASFVVEWALEWAKEQEDVPPYLIERLSRNLFDSHSTEVAPATAADALASALFGSAASAKLKIGEHEISLNRDGLKSLRKKTVHEE